MPHFYDPSGAKHALELLGVDEVAMPTGKAAAFHVSGPDDRARLAALVTQASQAVFEMTGEAVRAAAGAPAPRIAPAAFRDATGRLRVAYKEVLVRFKPGTPAATRDRILDTVGFRLRERSRWIPGQVTAKHAAGAVFGAELCDAANKLREAEEVLFAEPHFVSEYVRTKLPSLPSALWHLHNRAKASGQVKGADANVRDAWKVTMGRPSVVVAVLDDGVDVEHPNLAKRIRKKPDASEPRDRLGRDFFVAPDSPDHFDPRPKLFHSPFHEMAGNDIHGTPCAGVIASDGTQGRVYGAAPRCRILPVKIFHADDLAVDSRVADAIAYAARFATILSCSWGGGPSGALSLALEDASKARDGRGVPVFCATGNEHRSNAVGYPASDRNAIGVAACTDQDEKADYSNAGREVSICAPSNGGVLGITTTDVSVPNRGFNTGDVASGGKDGLFTNDFGGTSSATPLAAGVAALLLSKKPSLTAQGVREILQQTARKIGTGYDANGHSKAFGHGCVDAAAALAAL